MERAEVAERIRAAGLELRDEAEIVEVGARRATSIGDVTLHGVVHDAGLLLALWDADPPGSREVRGIVQPTMGAVVRARVEPDGRGYTLVTHPGAGSAFAFEAGGPDEGIARWRGPLPAWDGGRSVRPLPLGDAVLTLRAYAYGGLGGRAELVVEDADNATSMLTFGRPGGSLLDREALGRAEVCVPAPAPAETAGSPPLPWDPTAAAPVAVGRFGRACRGRVTGGSAQSRRRTAALAFGVPVPGGPDHLLVPGAARWRRIPPVVCSLPDAPRAVVQVPLGFDSVCLDFEVERMAEGNNLALRYRVRGGDWPFAALRARRGAMWLPMGGGVPDGQGWRTLVLGGGGADRIACVAVGRPAGPIVLPTPDGAPELADDGADRARRAAAQGGAEVRAAAEQAASVHGRALDAGARDAITLAWGMARLHGRGFVGFDDLLWALSGPGAPGALMAAWWSQAVARALSPEGPRWPHPSRSAVGAVARVVELAAAQASAGEVLAARDLLAAAARVFGDTPVARALVASARTGDLEGERDAERNRA